MNTRSTGTFASVFAGSLLLGFATVGCAENSDEPQGTQESSTSVEATDATDTRKACIDPETGELLSPSSEAECPTGAGEPDSLAEEETKPELTEEVQPDGSSQVDLKGQFKQKRENEKAQTGGGRLAVIDPVTGQLLQGRAAQERAKTELRTGNFAAALRALVETDVDVSELQQQRLATGGAKVDLQGRFRSLVFASSGKDGRVVVTHDVEELMRDSDVEGEEQETR